ncbi:MAG: AI-2E family transporter [Chloroflexi bacterium]|nr:AI-2E family transporter [Chloroflexota bacterium]
MKLSARERQLVMTLVVLLSIFLAFEVAARVYEAIIRVADVLIIFIVAWAVSYLLAPLVNRIDQRTRLNRVGSVLVVYVAIAVLLAIALALAVPGLALQLQALSERGPEYGARARDSVAGLQTSLDHLGVPVNLTDLYGQVPQRLADLSGAIAHDALGFVSATAALVFNAVLVLIIAFIMLLDGDELWSRFTNALNDELRSEAELFRQSADRSFGGFVRGSLLLGLFYGIASLVYLVPLGVPFAGVLALVAGLAVMIPFFGPLIAFGPVLVVTALSAPDRLLPVLIVTILLQQVTLNVIGPRILSNAIGIHPLFVFLALLLGSRIGGFWGVLLAMPFAGIINTFVRYAYELAKGRRARTDAATLIEDRQIAEAAAESADPGTPAVAVSPSR